MLFQLDLKYDWKSINAMGIWTWQIMWIITIYTLYQGDAATFTLSLDEYDMIIITHDAMWIP